MERKTAKAGLQERCSDMGAEIRRVDADPESRGYWRNRVSATAAIGQLGS